MGVTTGDQITLTPDPERIHRFDDAGNTIHT